MLNILCHPKNVQRKNFVSQRPSRFPLWEEQHFDYRKQKYDLLGKKNKLFWLNQCLVWVHILSILIFWKFSVCFWRTNVSLHLLSIYGLLFLTDPGICTRPPLDTSAPRCIKTFTSAQRPSETRQHDVGFCARHLELGNYSLQCAVSANCAGWTFCRGVYSFLYLAGVCVLKNKNRILEVKFCLERVKMWRFDAH